MSVSYRLNISAVCILLSLSACGDAASQAAGGSDPSALPTDPIDLSQAYSFTSQEPAPQADLTCGFASTASVNAIYDRILGNVPFVLDEVTDQECAFTNRSGVFFSIKRIALSDAREPARDRYNLDIVPSVTAVDGPGENAVVLSDEILEGPYAVYFEKDGNQFQLRLNGLESTQESMLRLAREVADNSDAQLAVAPVNSEASQSLPVLAPCEPFTSAQITGLFGSPDDFSEGSSQETSTCEYRQPSGESNLRSLTITYSGDPFNPSRFSPYSEPEQMTGFDAPVYRNQVGSRDMTIAIVRESGYVQIFAGYLEPTNDDPAMEILIANIIQRTQ